MPNVIMYCTPSGAEISGFLCAADGTEPNMFDVTVAPLWHGAENLARWMRDKAALGPFIFRGADDPACLYVCGTPPTLRLVNDGNDIWEPDEPVDA